MAINARKYAEANFNIEKLRMTLKIFLEISLNNSLEKTMKKQ